jgi:hypothetical protein
MSEIKLKHLLVGEDNPYGSRPEYALYPLPEGASGDRLCRLVMGLDHDTYLDAFERGNLCTGKWSMPAARTQAARVLQLRPPEVRLVLLGSKVAQAFGLEFAPFTAQAVGLLGHRAVLLPHPSGRNRIWNEPGAFRRARNLLHAEGVLPERTVVME